jgi:hypothetical protein
MPCMTRGILPALAAFALGACGNTTQAPVEPATQAGPQSECAAGDLERTLVNEPKAQVIVLLQADVQAAPTQQAKLLEELGADFQLARSYTNLPGFAGTITRHGYELARAHRDVRCIQLDHPGSGGG